MEPPRYCPNGHRLAGGRVLVGTETGGHSHRTYLCRVCGQLGTDQLDGSRRWAQDYLGPVIAVPADPAIDRGNGVTTA